MLNTVNYNVSLARAWVALAQQKERALRGAMPAELKKLQRDVLTKVLNYIRELVIKRKRALAVCVYHAVGSHCVCLRAEVNSGSMMLLCASRVLS